MNRRTFLALASAAPSLGSLAAAARTRVSIRGDDFLINGIPTYRGRTWNGLKIEGLLLNARMVQGIFDDLNPQTRSRWAYPDAGKWDPERNTREFVAAMPEWRRNGLLAFTINLQGGSPEGYSNLQPWENTAFDPEGSLRPAYMRRLARIMDRADSLGMVTILGCFYFGQDERLKDEAAVRRALANAVDWTLKGGYRNVLIEVNNECNVRYDHDILKPPRVHELIEYVKGRGLPAGTSFGGGAIPTANVVKASDFLLVHGNGADDPARIVRMIEGARKTEGYRPMPIVVNEDDHYRFDEPTSHMLAALKLHASWGYFEVGASNYRDGYQCPPVNWGVNTARKRAFFAKVKEISGS